MSTIRDKIDEARQARGLSINELSILSDVPYASVYGLLSGASNTTMSNIQKLADVLDLEFREKVKK